MPHETEGLRRTLSIQEQEHGNINPRGYYVGAILSGRLVPRALICSQAVSGCVHQLKMAFSKPERDKKLRHGSSVPLSEADQDFDPRLKMHVPLLEP